MHAEPLDNTTAAMVTRLPADPAAVAAAWVCLGSPCVGAFLPCYLEGKVPDRLARGGKEADADSPWWRMRRLLVLVARDFGRFGPIARRRWDAFEAALAREAAGVEAGAEAARRGGRTPAAAAALTAFMDRSVDAYLAEAEELARELGG